MTPLLKRQKMCESFGADHRIKEKACSSQCLHTQNCFYFSLPGQELDWGGQDWMKMTNFDRKKERKNKHRNFADATPDGLFTFFPILFYNLI
jgi:hypothetical protein